MLPGRRRIFAARFLIALLLLPAGACWNTPKLERTAFNEWERVLHSHRGAIVVVSVWASWCRACVEMFPEVVAAYRKYGSTEVAFLSVCLDDHDDPGSVALAEQLLSDEQATFPHYLFQNDIAESYEGLQLREVPAVLIYDPDGELRYRLQGGDPTNGIKPEDLQDAIESLLVTGET